jgi:hypothetical protein
MLQPQVWRPGGTPSLQLSRLQAHQGRDAKEKVAVSAEVYKVKDVLFQPRHPRTILRGGATQQHTATAVASSTLDCTGLPRHSGRNDCPAFLEAQPTTRLSRSVQDPKANSSSLNDIFKVVATIFQQIATELNGAEAEEDKITAVIKIVLKLMKQNVR